MRLRNPSVWIATLSAGAVIGIVLSDIGQRPSPGPLAEVHGREDDLSGKHDCSECHGGWRQTMTQACLVCHGAIGEDVEAGRGLHGLLGKQKAQACGGCHSEHHGTEFPIVNDKSFAAADVPVVNQFDHDRVGWQMGGKHLEITCDKCHTHAAETVLPKGELRYRGLQQDCKSCHDDPHKGRMALACAQCHSQEDFKTPIFSDHDRHLPLIGGHGAVSCRSCHAQGTPHGLEALGRDAQPPPRDCTDCHSSPHDREFVRGVAAMTSKPPGASCVECHRPEHLTFLDGTIEVTAEQHAKTRMPLDPPHDKVSCEGCHALDAEDFEQRFPGRGERDCQRCHQDVHGGQFDVGQFAVRSCVECHDPLKWAPHTYTKEKHAKSEFPLTGKHFDTDCNQCHKIPDEGSPRVFDGTPKPCEGCHKDAHSGFFDKFAKREPRAPRDPAGSCNPCHGTTTFSELPAQGFDHARWTGFALLGAHQESECESCHPRAAKADAAGRTFGLVAQSFGKVQGCATCHKDAHAGLFDQADKPHQVQGRTGCARCHDEVSFRTIRIDFDHGKWTGYVLDGAHATIGCSECHSALSEPDGSGRTFAQAKGRACNDCHEDNHAGQFEKAGRTDCQRCHRSATSFSDLYFKHNLHSRYRLDETHAAVACDACHKTVREGGREFVRYRPLGMECSDCHGAPQDALRRRKEKHE